MLNNCIQNIKIGDKVVIEQFNNIHNARFTIVGIWSDCHLLGTNTVGYFPRRPRDFSLKETYAPIADKFFYFLLVSLKSYKVTKIIKNKNV